MNFHYRIAKKYNLFDYKNLLIVISSVCLLLMFSHCSQQRKTGRILVNKADSIDVTKTDSIKGGKTTKIRRIEIDSCISLTTNKMNIGSESFEDFYLKFNDNLAFQKARTKCKVSPNVDFDVPNLDTVTFKVRSVRCGNDVTETITLINDSTYHLQYVFRLIKDKWFLVSYVDQWFDSED